MFPRRMEIFFFLALVVHALFFSLVDMRLSTAAAFPLTAESVKSLPVVALPVEEFHQKAVENRHETRKMNPEPLVVIPVPADSNVRWIVELADISDEVEPEHARFVSERRSRTDEEMQAEHTSREPRHSLKRREEGSKKRNGTVAEARARRNVIALRTNPMSTSQPIPRLTHQPTSQPETSPSGIPEAGEGDMAVSLGNQDNVKRPGYGKNLFPSLGELAQDTQSSRPGTPGATGVGRTDGDSDLPGVPQAPENFLPMVKKRGPITLLNAKSYTFSGFVRRVAHRMFDQFVIGFDPRRFGGSDWSDIQKGAVYEAIMNLNGRAVNIIERRSSGSNTFDSLVKSSVGRGAWDTNVPEGAECADGFVHFMFIPKVIPSEATSAADGSRTYSSFYLLAVAGLKECE